MIRKFALLLLLSLLLPASGAAAAPQPLNPGASFEVLYSPSPQSEEAIVEFIRSAKRSVHLAAYSFTSKAVAQALRDTFRRGIEVRVVVDAGQVDDRYSAIRFLANADVPVRLNGQYAIQHSKYIVVDGRHLETGSYNYTASAKERNSENVLFLRDAPEVAAKYEENWRRLWEEGETLAPRSRGRR